MAGKISLAGSEMRRYAKSHALCEQQEASDRAYRVASYVKARRKMRKLIAADIERNRYVTHTKKAIRARPQRAL